MNIKITAIIEDTCYRHGLLAQHGQSLLINFNGNKYLFDVGEIYEGLIYNLKALKINIEEIKAIIISHRHGDHCGALVSLLAQLKNQTIYFPDDTLKKYNFTHVNNELVDDLNLAQNRFGKIISYPKTQVVIESLELEKDLYLTGLIGDKIQEQAIVIDLKAKGLVILVGCSHPGLEAIVNQAKKVTSNQKIYGIIGGFHYKDYKTSQLEKAVIYLKKLNPDFIVPSHCTGSEATFYLRQNLGNKIHVSKTGSLGVSNNVTISPRLNFDFSKH
jgi:7,8-dihydropterin-6-yl-methyl-4-(beta-D-ribofuranosyl)aminobenzene 5'-phosphate synthase